MTGMKNALRMLENLAGIRRRYTLVFKNKSTVNSTAMYIRISRVSLDQGKRATIGDVLGKNKH